MNWSSSNIFHFIRFRLSCIDPFHRYPRRIIIQNLLEVRLKSFVVHIRWKISLPMYKRDISFVQFNHLLMQLTQKSIRSLRPIIQIRNNPKKDPWLKQQIQFNEGTRNPSEWLIPT